MGRERKNLQQTSCWPIEREPLLGLHLRNLRLLWFEPNQELDAQPTEPPRCPGQYLIKLNIHLAYDKVISLLVYLPQVKLNCFFFFFKILFTYSWDTERGREKGRNRRSKLHARSPMWDLIPGLRDHTLSWRQPLNHWATQASQNLSIHIKIT